ncbi:PIN domain-containing protein [Devosia nitrariae]|uniref:PIN domain-containing protein n=2 Tax=Devosia nitrariae TaxID=2071872 RepID=A0ABQ5W0J4_9HYPH|nr:PIN domain-containing protein [Devosia nitrariae]
MAQDQPVADTAREQIGDALSNGDGISISPITAWEIGLLSRRGRLNAALSPHSLFERLTSLVGVRVEPLVPSILIDSSFLPGEFHNDPADRIIVATARALELTIVTRDRAILDYARQGHVLALAC